MKTKFKNKLSPTQIIAVGFLITIFIGSILLKLPISNNGNFSYLESLFTATSATCVTGHSTVDVEATFTLFGQIVLLCLIQIGGLGFILVIALIFIWLGKKMTLKNRILISQAVSKNDFQGVVRLLRKIIKYTFTFELFGALIIATRVVPELGWGEGLFKSLFHSVSAFCNAGFDIFKGESLVPFVFDKTINITLIILIMIGGLGFLVWEDISNCIGKAIRGRKSLIKAIKKFSLHTKLVLIMQVSLFILGTFAFLFFEYNNDLTIGNMDFESKVLVSSFQSASARTAGFYTVNMGDLQESTKLIMILLMFIGGAPGSMAGGVKTITLLVICYGIFSMIKGKKNISIFKKTISKETFEKACAIFFIMMVISYLSLLIIMCNIDSNITSLDILFDVVSSIATVGLTTGAIENMNSIGIINIILLMYIGRVGTITTAVAFVIDKPKENDDIVYAKEDVIVG